MPVLHALAAALVISAAHAAAVSPETEAASARSSGDSPVPRLLEDLVRDMATGQQASEATSRSEPEEHDVFILEDTGRRQLGGCSCNEYRNGASPEQPSCAKVENGRTVCMPMHNGQCHSQYVACRGKKQFAADVLSASPMPRSDVDEDGHDVYVNVNLALSHAGSISASQLPSADAFAASLAKLGDVESDRVHALTSWAAGNGQRSSDAMTLGTRVTVHATFTAKGSRRREALEAQLQMADSLSVVGVVGKFEVVSLEILDQAMHPLICSPDAESLKTDASALLKQLVALKETELDLVRQAIARGSNPAPSDCAVLRKAAAQLGVDISGR